ncbi:hypothetical protein ACWFPY_05980 [Nocardia fluminea]
MTFLLDIATNLIANVVFWALLGTVFLVGSRVIERRMVAFFGLSEGRQIQVILSNLADPHPDGRPRYSLSLHEFQAAQSVNKLFGGAPLRLPELVRGLVDGIWLRRQVQCRTEVSPLASAGVDGAILTESCIVVGGGARNSVRKYGLDHLMARATLAGELFPEQPVPASGDEVAVTVRLEDGNVQRVNARKNLAVIEKVTRSGGYVNFFCHGVRADTTWVAVEYLVRNWKQVSSEFGRDDFVLVLGVPWDNAYFTDYLEPVRIATVRTTPS